MSWVDTFAQNMAKTKSVGTKFNLIAAVIVTLSMLHLL